MDEDGGKLTIFAWIGNILNGRSIIVAVSDPGGGILDLQLV